MGDWADEPQWDEFNDYDDDDLSVDPPLYPDGYLASLTLEQLEAEHERQRDRQGSLGDADRIDDRAVEETERRCRRLELAIQVRKIIATAILAQREASA